jgi:hypothetical protein
VPPFVVGRNEIYRHFVNRNLHLWVLAGEKILLLRGKTMFVNILAQVAPSGPRVPLFVGPSIVFLILFLLVPLGIFLFFRLRLRKLAATFGYPGVMPYLRAVPRDQAEKQAAVDLVMKGVVLCLLGVVFPLLVLIGAFPLYYGVRKLLLIGFGIGPNLPPNAK